MNVLLLLALCAPLSAQPRAPRRLHVPGAGPAAQAIVKFGQDVTLGEGQAVEGPVVAVGGSVSVDGPIAGPVVALGGSASAGPHAVVQGPLVAFGGPVQVDPAASVHGPIVRLPGAKALAVIAPPLAGLAAAAAVAVVFGKALAAIGWLALAVALWALFPDALERTRDTLRTHTRRCAVWGVLAWPLLGLISVAFLVSLIGIPFVPLVGLLAAAAYAWGSVALAYWIGDRITSGSERALLSIVVGILTLKFVGLIPFIGRLVLVATMIFGAGAAFASGFGVRTPSSR